MLKPVDKKERLDFTLKIQASKAIDEILNELLEAGYLGFVDIVFDLKHVNSTVKFEVTTKKLQHKSAVKTPNSIRFQVTADGARMVE